MALGRNDASNFMQMESYDVKFICTTHGRNWNRSYCPFFGCHCQRVDSFKLDHQCDEMIDDERMLHHKNAADEWEHELSVNADCSVDNHKDWRAENNFGLNPTVAPTSKIRHNVGSCVPCAIARKIILCFRWFIE